MRVLRATLKAGMTERRNDGMAESRNGGKYPQILKDGIAESRNGGKYPQILKDGMTENHPKSQKTESRKINRNPKRWNRGKSTEILKDGSEVHTYTASTAQAYTTSTARDICTLAVLCSVFLFSGRSFDLSCRFTHRLPKLKIHCVCHSLCI